MKPIRTDVASWQNQFVLTRNASSGPEGWPNRSLGDWHLFTHAVLPVIPVRGDEGSTIGWLLGWPVCLDSERILQPEDEFRLGAGTEELYRLGGRWLALLIGLETVCGDPSGSIAAVYDPVTGVLASTTGLLPPGSKDAEHASLVDAFNIPQDDNFYAFGLTAHPQARRLLPNHMLDLRTFEETRFWPGRIGPDVDDTDAVVDRIIDLVGMQLRAITRQFELKGNITAGYDTRMILALCRPYARQIRYVTRDNGKFGDAVDANTARQIASDNGLDLTIRGDGSASQAELDSWQERTGHCVAGAVWRSLKTWKDFEPNRSNITGVFSPLKGYYRTDEPLERFSGRLLVELAKLPLHPVMERAADQWLANVRKIPGISQVQVLDLMLIEQRKGCWAAPPFYGSEDAAPSFWLLSHREIIDLMLRLPKAYKLGKCLAVDTIRKAWPELLNYRFNAPSGFSGAPLYLYGAYRLTRSKFRRLMK